jgi:hypothetical protein
VFLIARTCSQGTNVLDGCSAAARVVQDSRRDKVVNLDELRPIARVFRSLADLSQGVKLLRLIGHELEWHQASPTWRQEGDRVLFDALCSAIYVAMPTDVTEPDQCERYAIALNWAARLFE